MSGRKHVKVQEFWIVDLLVALPVRVSRDGTAVPVHKADAADDFRPAGAQLAQDPSPRCDCCSTDRDTFIPMDRTALSRSTQSPTTPSTPFRLSVSRHVENYHWEIVDTTASCLNRVNPRWSDPVPATKSSSYCCTERLYATPQTGRLAHSARSFYQQDSSIVIAYSLRHSRDLRRLTPS